MAKAQDIHILLVRASGTVWDEAGRLQSETDLPLSKTGRAELDGLCASLNGLRLSVIFTAPDEASAETAEALASRCGGRLRSMPGLAEPGVGLWEGLKESELTERYAKAYRQWQEDPSSVQAPEGEDFDDASERILAAVGRALEKAGKDAVAIVARPMAHAIVRGWLTERTPQELADERDDDVPAVERHVVARERAKRLRERKLTRTGARK